MELKESKDMQEVEVVEHRVRNLKKIGKYTDIEIEKIIFTELDEMGLKSEYYVDIVEKALEKVNRSWVKN